MCHWTMGLNSDKTMATASWGTYRGHDGMRPRKFSPSQSIGRRVIAFPTFFNMAAVRHLELEFCHSGPPTKSIRGSMSKFGVDLIFAVGNIAILWFCQFGCKVPIHARFWGIFLGGGVEPRKIVGRHHNPQKAHPWVTTRHLSHKLLKSVQGCDLGATARKKVLPGQDRTIKVTNLS